MLQFADYHFPFMTQEESMVYNMGYGIKMEVFWRKNRVPPLDVKIEMSDDLWHVCVDQLGGNSMEYLGGMAFTRFDQWLRDYREMTRGRRKKGFFYSR